MTTRRIALALATALALGACGASSGFDAPTRYESNALGFLEAPSPSKWEERRNRGIVSARSTLSLL